MRTLTPEKFARVERLFHEAAQLPPAERDAWLDLACANDADVREEVDELLRRGSKADSLPPMLDGVNRALGAPSVLRTDPREAVGTRVGEYEVTAVLGQGGMGVVFRARDTRLGRDVAMKALPPALVTDPARMARFRREAKLLASLSHPNIATVFELEEAAGTQFLVMELIDGRSLAHRIARGPLPIPDALRVCREVAQGVEAAHDAGVVHRDLKPANVMCAEDGRVKVLDFGLAREFRTRPVSSTEDGPPTWSLDDVDADGDGLPDPPTHATRAGAVMGTPGYMSPEQVRGLVVDRRTDVFAIGCILYECLTGRLAFPGDTAADVIAGVIEREPDWSLLPARTPEPVRRLLRRCLAKDVPHRLRDVGDVRLELEDALAARGWLATGAADPERDTRPAAVIRRRALFVLPWLLLAAAVAVSMALALRTPTAPSQPAAVTAPPAPMRRFALAFPNNLPQQDLARLRLALSRDGGRLVLSASDGQRPHLFVRGRTDLEFRRLDDTADAFMPSFSPDGEQLVYFSDGAMLRRRLAGGGAMQIVEAGGYWGTYVWGSDNTITYAPLWAHGIARVGDRGGVAAFVTAPDGRDDFAHVSPAVLPDNRTVLFTAWNGADLCRIDALNLDTKRRHTVIEQGTTAKVARAPDGRFFVFHERSGTVYAAPFDPAAARRTGPEVAVADNVLTDQSLFHANYDVADDGSLAYVPGGAFVEQSRMAWVTGTRETEPFNDDRDSYTEAHFSADGDRLSVIVKGFAYHLHVYDLPRGTFDRVVVDGDIASAAVSPDGQSVAFCNNRDAAYGLWVRRLSDGQEERVFDGHSAYQAQPHWSADGKYLAFSHAPTVHDRRDIYVVDVQAARGSGGTRGSSVFVRTPAEERSPRFCPTGRWLAYASSASGTREVYVRSFPDGQQTRQVSHGGGDWPEWSPDGRTVYYRAGGKLLAVPVSTEDGTVQGRPTVVFDRRFGQSDFEMPDYTVHPKTGKILVVEPSERGMTVDRIHVVLNWHRLFDGR